MFEKRTAEPEKSKKITKAEKTGKADKQAKAKDNIAGGLKNLIIPLLLAAVVVSLIWLVMQNHVKNAEAKGQVVCATRDISANTYVKEKEIGDYFTVRTVDAEIIPENAITSLKDLPEGFYTGKKLCKDQMIYDGDLAEKDSAMEKYQNGYQTTSVAVEAYNNSVSGRIRHGDIVDLYALNPDTKQLQLMVNQVYVESAYDSSGAEITDDDGVAVDFTIRVATGEEPMINQAVAWKGIQLYKVK